MPCMHRIKEHVTIEHALAHYGSFAFKRSGSERIGRCPIHASRATSTAFHISADGRAWYCFGLCQRGGSVIDLIAALEHCGIPKAAAILSERYVIV